MMQGIKNSSADTGRGQPHILVVDDEAFIRDALELYFESNDFEVSTASSGGEALKIFDRVGENIDLVLLDLVMPGMHGLEVLRELKRVDPAVQVIIATGCNSMDNAFEALRLGAIDYITKPILDFEEDLLKTVSSALSGNRAEPPPLREETAEAPRPEPSRPGPARGALIEKLAGIAGSRLRDPGDQELAWKTLEQGFEANAALIIRKLQGGAWQCLQSWGFIDMDAPRSLWHDDGQGPAEKRPTTGWSGVLNIPFHGEPGEELLLMLFYRDLALSGRGGLPIETLSAVFSHVYNGPRSERHPANRPAERSLDVDLSI
jgi:CheY-like chemotaxis protein